MVEICIYELSSQCFNKTFIPATRVSGCVRKGSSSSALKEAGKIIVLSSPLSSEVPVLSDAYPDSLGRPSAILEIRAGGVAREAREVRWL